MLHFFILYHLLKKMLSMKVFTSNWIELNFEEKACDDEDFIFSPSLLVMCMLDSVFISELHPQPILFSF